MRKKILWSLLGLALAAVGVFGYYAYSFLSFADKISTSPEKSTRFKNVQNLSTAKGGENLTPPKWEGKERVNILLLGGDSRGLKDNEIPRSDTVMIVSLDPVTKKSYLFSILRDTYVKIPNHGSDRINTAITTGGPELAMKTVSNLMGIPIQYYVYTDFKGFIALVDAVGGIDLDVEKDMKYSDAADGHEYDINLKKGFQHLDGKTALQYVRFRHDATSDFTRTERQRKFMKALAEKLQSSTSLIKLPRILQSLDPFIETNLTVSQMLKLGSLGFEVKTDGMVSQQIPPLELLEEKRVGGAEVIGVDPVKLQPFIKQLFGDTPEAAKTTSGKVSMGGANGVVAGVAAGIAAEAAGGFATKAPVGSVKPAVTPKATVKPAATQKPVVKPSAAPSATAGGATLKPSPSPEPSAAPSAKAPVPAPSASVKPGTGTGTGGSTTGGTGTVGGTASAKPAAGNSPAPAPTPKPTAPTTASNR